MKTRLAAAVLLVGLLAPAAWAASEPRTTSTCGTAFPTYTRATEASGEVVQRDVEIPMSDGVVLRADVHLPAGRSGRFPTALTVTGYGKEGAINALPGGGSSLVPYGYAYVIVDDRGTGDSGGSWDSWGPRTRADYPELLDWIVRQPWSDGRIGVTGESYMGITSLYLAATGKPAVKGAFATVPMADGYRDIVFAGGQVNTAFIPLWEGLVTGLSLMPSAAPQTLPEHATGVAGFQAPTLLSATAGGEAAYDGPFWRQRSPIEAVGAISAPTFIVGGLDDIFQRGEPLLYEKLATQGNDTRLLIGPWTHIAAGNGLPADGVPSLDSLLLQWFDQHVRGMSASTQCIPPVTQYVRGVDHFRSARSWPVPGLVAERAYLHGDGTVSPTPGTASDTGRTFVQAPVTGVCTRSTAQWLIGAIDRSPCATDNRGDEVVDTLTYTSAPVRDAITVNGPIEADVWITTTASDASVSVAVSDVAPDGTSRGLTNGLLLASLRATDPSRSRKLGGQSIQPWHPFTKTSVLPVRPGEPTLLPIEVFPTSAMLAPGHRLRITIAPADVPHALPPVPNLLQSFGGRVTVLSDAAHPSSVVFPVVR